MDIYAKHGLSAAKIEEVATSARDWATAHGVVMRNKSNITLNQHAPFALFPSPFPAYLHKEAFQVQKDFQTLFHRASLDHEFIESSLKRWEFVGVKKALFQLVQYRSSLSQPAKLQKKQQCEGVYFWLYDIAYWMPIQQKLPPPVLLFSDFAGWVTFRMFGVIRDERVLKYQNLLICKNSLVAYKIRSERWRRRTHLVHT